MNQCAGQWTTRCIRLSVDRAMRRHISLPSLNKSLLPPRCLQPRTFSTLGLVYFSTRACLDEDRCLADAGTGLVPFFLPGLYTQKGVVSIDAAMHT